MFIIKKPGKRAAAVASLLGVLTLASAQQALAGDGSPHPQGGWTMSNYDPEGTRYNSAEHQLGPRNVGGLKVLWRVPTSGTVTGTPAVSDGVVYAGDLNGDVYAVRADGTVLWTTHVIGRVSASIAVIRDTLVFGDLAGYIYGLDPRTGAIRWKIRPNPHPIAAIYGSATQVGKYFAIGTTIDAEEPGVPASAAAGGSGSVLLADPSDGRVIWQTYTVTQAELAQGATGADVWSTPAYDERSGMLYVATGNNFNPPVTPTEDAIIGLDARTGQIRWVDQAYNQDIFPTPGSPQQDVDYDFGDSPHIYQLAGGETVVGAGNKDGTYYVVDAATGAPVHQLQVEPGGLLGGLFATAAVHNDVVFANGINWPGHDLVTGVPPTAGDLIAIAGDGSRELWRFTTPGSPDLSGVAVANGVIYFQSMTDGNLYALDERTGAELAHVLTGGAHSGPAVVGGRIYLGTGVTAGRIKAFDYPGTPGIVAVGLGR